jgi:hypothetical protein
VDEPIPPRSRSETRHDPPGPPSRTPGGQSWVRKPPLRVTFTDMARVPRQCEYCGRAIVGGRKDKRFCNNACRTAAHRRESASSPKPSHERAKR